ncbi:ectonucleotide pyrophosphatase/phosphodiesterase [Cognatilysobacter lacus]|uniref:Alkaline phosphatase family protein n=1 Tax=Cognatilysobacter lacus TaxID=1643323 RepID=A0A5D8Z6S8_9GAMM|nr:ectonucleotide pyrophosphatase/phosphodiesterase [Lysobacter lacus]TZF90380.1 alkaline phosphatase family protein [Lysobacter lacus]
MFRPLAACLLSLVLGACASTPPPPPAAPVALVLVSLDGFRPVDLGRGRTPNLDALARDGVRAEGMRPSYPSLTFPNHYTLVTGLRPDHHGMVHNSIDDAVLGRFETSDDKAVGDGRWWGGEPIWATAEKAGIRSATMFWPGSAAAIGGVRPSEWRPYQESFDGNSRVDTVLGWLERPTATRPRFVALYFEDVDEAEHLRGPGAPGAEAAVAKVDGYIGRLRQGLAARGLAGRVNIVVVSDHGQAPVAWNHVLPIDSVVPPDVARTVTMGESVGAAPLPGHEDEAMRRMVGRHAHFECWPRARLPARWHYGSHPRVPPIVCQMDEGWKADTPAKIARRLPGVATGSHGYDPDLPSMRALFVANGPSFRHGVVLPVFDNVDVYPMLARLIGVTPQPNDGNAATLQRVFGEAR